MKRKFLLMLLLTLLPLGGWAQNVNWIPYTNQEYPIPYGLSGSNLSSLASKLSVTSGYGGEECMFSMTNIGYPSGYGQYNLALYDSWEHANSGTSTGLVTTTCETGKNYHLRVSARHRIAPGTYQKNYVTKKIIIVRADNKITSPFTIESWNYGEPRKYPTIPSTTDYSTPSIQYSGDGANWGDYEDIVNDFPGDWYVRAYVPQSTNYNVLSEVRQFRINPIPVNLTLDEVTKTWEKPWNNPTIDDLTSASYTVSGASWNDIKPYLKWDQVEPVVSAGTFKYTLKVTGKSIYGINIDDSKAILKVEKADATLSTVSGGPTPVYNGKPQALNPDATPEYKDKDGNVSGKIWYTLTPSDDSSWSTEVPKGTDAGSYTVYYKGVGDVNHINSAANKDYTVTIEQREIVAGTDFAVQTAVTPNVYTGSPLKLVNAATWKGEFATELASVGTFKYNGATAIPEGTTVGTYPVALTIDIPADANFKYTGTPVTIDGEITRAEAGDITVTPSTGLIFSYDPGKNKALKQTLITAGTCPGATVMYSLTGAVGSYSAAFPNGDHAETYTVYYYAKGDANHNGKGSETEPVGSVDVKIAKADYVLSQTPTAASNLAYNGDKQSLLAQGCKRDETLCPAGKVTYYLDDNHSNPISGSDFKNVKATDAGKYKVSWFVSAAPPFANDYKPITTASVKGVVATIDKREVLVGGSKVKGTIEELYDLTVTPAPPKYTTAQFLEDVTLLSVDEHNRTEILNAIVTPNVPAFQDLKIGDNTVTFTAVDDAENNTNYRAVVKGTAGGRLKIESIEAAIQADAAPKTDLIYNGADQELVKTPAVVYKAPAGTGSKAIGKVVYSLTETGTYTDDLTKIVGKDADTYTVYYKVELDKENLDRFYTYTAAVKSFTATIDQKALADEMFVLTPTEAVYNGENQLPGMTTVATEPITTDDWDFAVADGEGNPIADPNTGVKDVDNYAITFTGKGNYKGTADATFKITKAAATAEAPAAIAGLVYNGKNQALVTAPAYSGGTIKYSLNGTYYTFEDVPAVRDADDYTVYYMVEGDKNHTDFVCTEPVEVSIGKKQLTEDMFVFPDGFETTFNGKYQYLKFDIAKFEADILDDYTCERDDMIIDAGVYPHIFRGQRNYEGTFTVNYVVKPKAQEVVAPKPVNLTYNGTRQPLAEAGSTDAEGVRYAVNDGEFGEVDVLPEIKDAGKYTVRYEYVADKNHLPADGGKFEVEIRKANIAYMLSNLEKVWDGETFTPEQVEKLFTLYVGELYGEDKYDQPFVLKLPEDYKDVGTYTFKQAKYEFKKGYPENYKINFSGTAEIVITPAPPVEAMVIADNEDWTTEAKHVEAVTFTDRKINAGNWNVVALPFETTVKQVSDAFGYAAVDVLNETAADGSIHFRAITSGVIPAYTPFIVKTTEDEDLVKDNFNQVVFEDVDIEAWPTAKNSEVKDAANNKFIGTFQAVTAIPAGSKSHWYMSKGTWYDTANRTKAVNLKAFRAYVEFDPANVAAGARIYIEEPDGTETSIDAIEFNQMVNGDNTYTVDGKKVSNTAQKGVYIQNGRVIVQ